MTSGSSSFVVARTRLDGSSHVCYSRAMKQITQRELRNYSGQIMKALDHGEAFLITRNGVAVGQLTPLPRRRFVHTDDAQTLFLHIAPIDWIQFRQDVDAFVDQHPYPHE